MPSKVNPHVEENNILARLSMGGWSFGKILPSFRQNLQRALCERGEEQFAVGPMPVLSARYYRRSMSIPDTLLAVAPEVNFVPHDMQSIEAGFWFEAAAAANEPLAMHSPTKTDSFRLEAAIDRIDKYAPITSTALKVAVSHFCCFSGKSIRSFSHPHFFGCIFLDPSHESEKLAISIVHELAHQELFILNLVDRLISIGSDHSLAHAPFQGTVRPAIGRLHAAHALFRMVQFHKACGAQLLEDRHYKLLKATISTFSENSELTPFAQRLVNEVYDKSGTKSRHSEASLALDRNLYA